MQMVKDLTEPTAPVENQPSAAEPSSSSSLAPPVAAGGTSEAIVPMQPKVDAVPDAPWTPRRGLELIPQTGPSKQ